MGVVAIVGAAVCWLLVRRGDHQVPTGIFSRRSRWSSGAEPKAGP
jgi:hypothetical protein